MQPISSFSLLNWGDITIFVICIGMSMANNENLDAEEQSTVTLSLDDGSELECAVIAIFPAGQYEYIALLPLEGEEAEEGEVYLYRFEEDEDGNPNLTNIEDDEEYDLVSDAFDELLDSEEYDELIGEDELD